MLNYFDSMVDFFNSDFLENFFNSDYYIIYNNYFVGISSKISQVIISVTYCVIDLSINLLGTILLASTDQVMSLESILNPVLEQTTQEENQPPRTMAIRFFAQQADRVAPGNNISGRKGYIYARNPDDNDLLLQGTMLDNNYETVTNVQNMLQGHNFAQLIVPPVQVVRIAPNDVAVFRRVQAVRVPAIRIPNVVLLSNNVPVRYTPDNRHMFVFMLSRDGTSRRRRINQ
jgi:hypothetical protein